MANKVVKNKQKKVTPAQTRKSPAAFLKEVNAELKKVTWPNRQELISSTIIVIVAVTLIAAYIGVVDAVFNRLVVLLEL